MQYANIDVSSIAPTHLVSPEHPQADTSTEKKKLLCNMQDRSVYRRRENTSKFSA